jgi:hypothetical protein
VPKPTIGDSSFADDFIACVRASRPDAPAPAAAFDRWLERTEATDPDALNTILPGCKRALDPGAKSGDAVKPRDCVAEARGKAGAVDTRR